MRRFARLLRVYLWTGGGILRSYFFFNIWSQTMDLSQRKGSSLWFPQALVLAMAALGVTHVGAAEVVSPAASATVSRTIVKPTVGKVVVKTPATVGGVTAVGGENQYPTGSIPIPPKPKKEGLEGAAIKVQAGKAAQP